MLDLGDLQFRNMFVLASNTQILNDLVGLFGESLVYLNGVFGIRLREFEVVTCICVKKTCVQT